CGTTVLSVMSQLRFKGKSYTIESSNEANASPLSHTNFSPMLCSSVAVCKWVCVCVCVQGGLSEVECACVCVCVCVCVCACADVRAGPLWSPEVQQHSTAPHTP